MSTLIGLVAMLAVAASLPPKDPQTTTGRAEAGRPIRRAVRLADPPRLTGGEIAGEFVRRVAESEEWSTEAKSFVARQAAALNGMEPPADFIETCLAVLSAEYKRGLDLIFDDQPAGAADVFERLAASGDPFLALAAAKEGASALVELEEVERCRRLLDEVMRKHAPFERYTLRPDPLLFMLGYCQVQALDYENAHATLSAFQERFPNAPERLRLIAAQILTELDRRLPGRIGDVRDLLSYARRRIVHGATDEEVQSRQAEAVALLDRLIEESEQKENEGGECDGSKGEGKGQDGAKPGGTSQGGAKQSTLPQGGEGKEARLRSKRARPGEAWGRMPPKEREQILQTLQKEFPSRYRELIEQYYRELSKDGAAP